MEDIVHVDITNVAFWYYELNAQDEYSWIDDFPCILSPWRNTVFEYYMSRRINHDGKITILPRAYQSKKHRTRIISERIEDDETKEQLSRKLTEAYGYCDGEPYWYQVMSHSLDGINILEATAVLNRTGAILGAAPINIVIPKSIALMLAENGNDLSDGPGLDPFYPAAFTISLLHCRNVEIRDRPISRQQRRMAERTGRPVITYKELVIDAFRKQVHYETQAEGGNEIKRALHICRGHFAHYGDDNPLFGKYTGTFWKPMHVRGNKEVGQVHKSYKVKSPE